MRRRNTGRRLFDGPYRIQPQGAEVGNIQGGFGAGARITK